MKVYPQSVIDRSEQVIQILKEEGFYDQPDMNGTTEFSYKYFCDYFINHFIKGDELQFGDEKEMDQHLNNILIGTIFFNLKKRGIVDSYEDDTTDEVFFLTQKGKNMVQ